MRTICLSVVCASWLLLPFRFSASAQMVASVDRVRIEGRLTSESDHKDLKGTSADTVTQKKSLTIQLSGQARSPETRKVKWTAYGRNVANNDLVVLDSAEVKLALDQHGTQTITTKTFTSTYTPEHAVTEKRGGGGNNGGKNKQLPRSRKVEAEGKKYAGYSVQVLDGGKVVGETSDPQGIALKK
jgi:hypothetical protein